MALIDGTFHLPMFPLGTVIWPGDTVPLRVFEDRYRRLVLDCLDDPSPAFGSALIARGSEVGGGDERMPIGTIVSIRSVQPTGEGTFAVTGLGAIRIRVRSWLEESPYPEAELEEFEETVPEDASDLVDGLAALADRATEIRALATRGQRAQPVASLHPEEGLVAASYRIAGSLPLGPADRYAILAAPDVAGRLAIAMRAFDDVEGAVRFGQQ